MRLEFGIRTLHSFYELRLKWQWALTRISIHLDLFFLLLLFTHIVLAFGFLSGSDHDVPVSQKKFRRLKGCGIKSMLLIF